MPQYRGSERWQQDVDAAREKFKITADGTLSASVDQSGVGIVRVGQIRYVEAEADTGSRYVVVATPLPPGSREGGPVLVTVLQPWQDAWTLQYEGALHSNYVGEHLSDGRMRDGRLHGGDEYAITAAIAYALGREPVIG